MESEDSLRFINEALGSLVESNGLLINLPTDAVIDATPSGSPTVSWFAGVGFLVSWGVSSMIPTSSYEEEVFGSSLIIRRLPFLSYLLASPGMSPRLNGGIRKLAIFTRPLAVSSGGFGISRPLQFCGCAAIFLSSSDVVPERSTWVMSCCGVTGKGPSSSSRF